MPFLSSLDNFLSDACIIFQKGVDNFEIEHKTCFFSVRGAVPPKVSSWQHILNGNLEKDVTCLNLRTQIY